ncbi:MAG: hypothetical protein LBG52_08725 [Candidatus Peribacteria bacterium]|jgi:hypothetical protein|nr:hypothetical protein [Candidatus Peribacteria bacterium]
MSVIENNKSSSDNLYKVDWVQGQTKTALNKLQMNFFYKKEANGTIHYNMDSVRTYLKTLQYKSRKELTSQNTSAWIMAVQIALESM